jgi:hypothetical protein
MKTANTFMTYPRHGLLLVCDWINLILAVGIVAVGAYRTWGIRSTFRSRMDIVVITAVSPSLSLCLTTSRSDKTDDKGGKSIAFLTYILSTSHISSWRRWYNVTTVFVMAIIDTLFWAGALGLTAYGLIRVPPTGLKETLTYVLIALVAVIL